LDQLARAGLRRRPRDADAEPGQSFNEEGLFMRRRIATLAAAASLLGAAGAAPPSAVAMPIAAKPCSSGWTHASINGAHKCLRRGQFCARRADRQYHRYGFHCHKRDARGNYHLT